MIRFYLLTRGWLVALLGLFAVLTACTAPNRADSTPSGITPTQTLPPTPAAEIIQVSDTQLAEAKLHITVPSITFLQRDSASTAQLFLVLADPQGGFSYMLYPANSLGYTTDEVDLRAHPFELSISESTTSISLWVLAVHNTHYVAAERLGLDTLVASLGIGFRNWLANGDPTDDPLAAVVSASDGVLYEWFASIDVLGQSVMTFRADRDWDVGLSSQRSPDGGLNVVYNVNPIIATTQMPPSPTPAVNQVSSYAGYNLRINEDFSGGQSAYTWYQGGDSTYNNTIINGAYQIRLIDITQREFGLSWGSIEDEQFRDYIVEAEVSLAESDIIEGYYGLWLHYQDGKNFIYFGISNTGEYRVSVIQDNNNLNEIRDWTTHTAIQPGAATNTLTAEVHADGIFVLSINGEHVLTFTDHTYERGSVAFFCRAKSVITTCQLHRIHIWERKE